MTLAATLIIVAGLAVGSDDPPAPPTPPAPAAPASPAPPAPHDPTLDELLGLAPAPDAAHKAGVADPKAKELERQLSTREVDEEFAQAVGLMSDSAERLEAAGDAGLDTQRLQDEALQKLDKIIDAAQKNRSKQKQKSKPKPEDAQPQPGQQSSQQQQQQSQQASKSNQGGVPEVPRQDGQLGPAPAGSAASWGNLPEHVRRSLTEGRSDRFSSLYQQMTERYYKRLAEDKRSTGGPR